MELPSVKRVLFFAGVVVMLVLVSFGSTRVSVATAHAQPFTLRGSAAALSNGALILPGWANGLTASGSQGVHSSRDTLALQNGADLAIDLEVNRHQARPEQHIVFIMTLENHGPAVAQDVVFSKHEPDPLNSVAFFCVPPATLVGEDCHVPQIAPGEAVTGIAVLTPIPNPAPEECQFTTYAAILSAATPDPVTRNNEDTVRIRIRQTDLCP